jgi:quercetin dioxygenase-like cupin family protein
MKIIQTHVPADGALTQAFATVDVPTGGQLEVGLARLGAGTRVPETGESRHPDIEVSYVLSGVVDVVNEAGTRRISRGDLVIVPAGEWHYSLVQDEAMLVYAFVREAGKT